VAAAGTIIIGVSAISKNQDKKVCEKNQEEKSY
jgi:hypothetical protein